MTLENAGSPRDARPDCFADGPGEMMLRLLLQEHAAAQRSLLVQDVAARALLTLLVVYLGAVERLSVAHLVSAVLISVLLPACWQWGRRRAGRRARGIEETLSRMIGGFGEQAYIESSFLAESRSGSERFFARIEPAIWLYASLAVIFVNVLVNGVG